MRAVAGRELDKRDAEVRSLRRRLDAAHAAQGDVERELRAVKMELERAGRELEQRELEAAAELERAVAEVSAREEAVRLALTRANDKALKRAHNSAAQDLRRIEREHELLGARVRHAAALLRLNSPEANEGAYDLLSASVARTGAAGEALLVFEGDPEARLQQLTQLAAAEAQSGRWTALLRTELQHRRRSDDDGPRASEGFLMLNDTRSQNNIGCRATTTSLLAEVASHGVSVSHTVTLAELNELATQLQARAGQAPTPENFDVYADLVENSDLFGTYRQLAATCQGVIVNAEGSIYDRQAKGLVLLMLGHVLRERLNKPVAFVNYSAELGQPVMNEWASRTLPLLNWSAFREPISLAQLPGDVPPGPGWIPDAAFLVPTNAASGLPAVAELALGTDAFLAAPIEQPYVVISGSSSLYRRDRSPTDIRTAFVALCSRLQGAGVTPVLWEADQRDRILLRPTALQLQLPYASAAIPLHLAQALLAGAVCLVSGRWHASILAARWGCPPVLGDANFFKTSALHEMLGLHTPMFDFRELDSQRDDVVDAVLHLARNGDRERDDVAKRAAELAEQARSGLANMTRAMLEAT